MDLAHHALPDEAIPSFASLCLGKTSRTGKNHVVYAVEIKSEVLKKLSAPSKPMSVSVVYKENTLTLVGMDKADHEAEPAVATGKKVHRALLEEVSEYAVGHITGNDAIVCDR